VDEHQARGIEVRRRRSPAEAEQVVAAYGASGLSQVEFCRQEGLSLATLARYRKRQRQAQAEAATGNRWLAVEVSGVRTAVGSETASGLAIALVGGRRIEVGRGFDAPTLVQLLGVLEGR
jgi:transposase-like protein